MTIETAKDNYKPRKITGSLIGKMVKVVPTRTGIDIYLQPAWIIILSVWVVGGLFFMLSLFWDNLIFNCVMTVVGGVGGFFVTSRYVMGKLHRSFNYNEIVCIVANVPELTIIHGDQKMFELRMMSHPQKRLFSAITNAIEIGPYHLVKNHGRYYIALKEGTSNTNHTSKNGASSLSK